MKTGICSIIFRSHSIEELVDLVAEAAGKDNRRFDEVDLEPVGAQQSEFEHN